MANGTLKVENIQTSSGSGTITLGQSGETIALGATTNNLLTPYFQINLNASQTISDATHTVIQFDTVDYDTGSYWDSSNYRWKPLIAGKYLIYYGIKVQHASTTNLSRNIVRFQKNGSRIDNRFSDLMTTSVQQISTHSEVLITDMNGSTDYLDVTAYGDTSDSTSPLVGAKSTFGAYRLV